MNYNSVRKMFRKLIISKNRKRLTNRDFTVFSSNCIGGVLYHELGLKFLSPTINLYIEPDEYLNFLENPKLYENAKMEQLDVKNENYPVVLVHSNDGDKSKDIVLHCVHYTSFETVREKWNERFSRINWDNIYVFMCERDGCSYENIKRFHDLPYKHKVIFVHKEYKEFANAVYVPGTELNDDRQKIRILTDWKGMFGKKFIDGFDYVGFFNSK